MDSLESLNTFPQPRHCFFSQTSCGILSKFERFTTFSVFISFKQPCSKMLASEFLLTKGIIPTL